VRGFLVTSTFAHNGKGYNSVWLCLASQAVIRITLSGGSEDNDATRPEHVLSEGKLTRGNSGSVTGARSSAIGEHKNPLSS